jgi:hypothetical protein
MPPSVEVPSEPTVSEPTRRERKHALPTALRNEARPEIVALLRSTQDAPAPRRSPRLVHLAGPALGVLIALAGARLAGVDLLPPLPPAVAGEETRTVVAGPGVEAAVDAREHRSLRRATAAAVALASAPVGSSGKRTSRASEQPPGGSGQTGSGEQPPPENAGTGGTDPGLILPIVGETPVPDPGLETPELPVDPETTLPGTGDVLPDTGGVLPHADLTLP